MEDVILKEEEKMSKEQIKLGNNGTIEVRVDWNQYDRQRSGGLISGALYSNKDSVVDCDASAFVLKKIGDTYEYVDGATYDHPSIKDNSIVHHGDNMKIGGEEEQIDINLESLSENESVVLTLDTLKNKRQLKIGKISRISVIISKDNSELYRADFSGSGDKAVKLGIIDHNGSDYVFTPGLVGMGGVKEKSDLTRYILK